MMPGTQPRYHWLTRILIATALAVMSGKSLVPQLAQAQQCNSNDATAPCFAQNNDILAGQRHLLRNDDLVANIPNAFSASSTEVVNYLLDTTNGKVANQTQDLVVTANCAIAPPVTTPSQVRVGRVYALPNDVIVTLAPVATATGSDCTTSNGNDMAFYMHDPQDSSHDSVVPLPNSALWAQFALGDFNKDGFQDIFVISSSVNGTAIAGTLTADNPNNPSAGLAFEAGQGFPSSAYTPQGAPVVGDFNGDGALDIAWPGASPENGAALKIYFASVCPAAHVEVLGQTCAAAFQIFLSPQSIDTGHTITFSSTQNEFLPNVSLTADNFDGAVDTTTGISDAELLVALNETGFGQTTVTVYDFDANLVPTAGPNTLSFDVTVDFFPTIASGRLDWSSQQAQAVFAGVLTSGGGVVSVITFNATDLTMSHHDFHDGTFGGTSLGVAVGRFDPPDTSTGTDFNQQIAVLYFAVDGAPNETTVVRLYTVDPPSNFTPAFSSQFTLGGELVDFLNTVLVSPLQTGDLQGRSLLLGAPEKTTVAHTQPDTVLGLPPMHVDFIEPLGGGNPQVQNVTVFPSTFNTAYHFEVTTGMQASRQSTTSYTASTKESAEAKVSYGIPFADSVSATLKASATQTHQSTVAKNYNTYSGETYTFNTATQFDDKVAATSQQLNIYAYPVIGQLVCPQQSPNCPDDCAPGTAPCPMLPLYIQYSGPDNIIHIPPTDAAGLEWFQPPDEPGNLFSYPGSLALLQASVPQQTDAATGTTMSRLDLLTGTDEEWGSQSSETFSVDWTMGGGSNVSSGSVSTHSFDTSVTVSGKATFEGGSVSSSASVDYNQSTSVSTLNTSTQTFGESTGVTLNRGIGSGGDASNAEFLYEGQSYIFGQLAPIGTIQTDLQVNTDVQSQGYLQVGHAADPLSTDPITSGDWWKQAYTAAPDVALNHPQRWEQKEPTSQNTQQVRFNCPIGYTSAFGTPTTDPGACTSTNTTPTPTNVTDATFYQMKGLFVTPGTSAGGPTTTLATLGDTATLQARVYNYSLVNMPAGTIVHVRFYAQPWDATQGQFAAGSGKFGFAQAVLIGEVMLPPIPAFCGGSQGAIDACTDPDAPLNWVLAQAAWDTSMLNPPPTTETTWKFWVVVWMENGGSLVSEIAQHGLTGIPAQHVASLAEIPVETYSNNLGFYNQVFTLELPTNTALAGTAPTTEAPSLAIDAVEVSPAVVLRDEISVVRAHYRASGGRFDHVRAFLYGGDPRAGGALLDMDILPRVAAAAPFVVPFRYRPRACGAQTLVLQGVPLNGGGPAQATLDVSVTLDPIAQTQRLIEEVKSLDLASGTEQSLLAKLEAAEQSFQRGNQTAGLNQLHAFAHELSAKSGKEVPEAEATQMIAQVADLESCL